MRTKFLLPVLLIAGLAACSKEEAAAPAEETPAVTTAPAETTPAPVVAEVAPADTAPVSGEAVTGVAECDDFLAKYEACVSSKVPAEGQAVLQQGLAQWRQSWMDMGANEATAKFLPEVCTKAAENAKVATQMYGCEF